MKTAPSQLLRAIETKNFRRLGGTKDIYVDVRIISATNSDLKKKVDEKALSRRFINTCCKPSLSSIMDGMFWAKDNLIFT